MREILLPDLTVADTAALQQLVDQEPERMQGLLADARAALDDRYDRGRLLSRWVGWGWKLCLALMFVLPIAAGFYGERLRERRAQAHWRAAAGRKRSVPTSPLADGD
jgi:hypothetical protein